MVTYNDCKGFNEYDLRFKSTDEKPTNVAPNVIGLELDTGKFWFFDGDDRTWKKVGQG